VKRCDYANSDSYANTNIHSPAYSDSKAGTYWKTSPNPAPSAVAGGDELLERVILNALVWQLPDGLAA
jgi:hypothetical protein